MTAGIQKLKTCPFRDETVLMGYRGSGLLLDSDCPS
jgi:hypothetical protein